MMSAASLVFRNKDESNAHTVEAGAGSVWAGFCRSPSLLLDVSPTLDRAVPIRFDSEGGLHDLAFDGEHLWVAHASGHLSRLDPRTHDFHSRRIEVSSGRQAFLYALLFDGHDLWAGTYTDPGCVLRIDRDSESYEEFPIPEAPRWSVRTLVSVNNTLWAGLYTVPGRVVVLDKDSGEQTVVDLGDENMLCTSSAFDGSHVWIGLDTMPAGLVRVDPQSLEFTTYRLHPGSSCVRGLVFDGRYLWAGLYTEPGELVRFDPRSSESRRHVMPDEFFNVRDLALDGDRLWAVTQNVRHLPSGLYGLSLGDEGEDG
jgi:streptogramin lyase